MLGSRYTVTGSADNRKVVGASSRLSSMNERTFVMAKPDAVQRGLVGEIIKRLEQRQLRLVGIKRIQIDQALAEKHYGVHREKPFFSSLIEYITSGPVVPMVWEGPNAIAAVRATMGATHPLEASPGTVRGDFGLDIDQNLVHSSDGPDTAQAEILLFFGASELGG